MPGVYTKKFWSRARPVEGLHPQLAAQLGELGPVGAGHAVAPAFVDVGLGHPVAQAALADPEVVSQLSGRLGLLAGQLDRPASELLT